jgi:CPA1 family monovalent cation:H+ antiporter
MLLLITVLLFIILFSRLTEESTKIPATLGTIFSAYMVSYFFPSLFSVNHEDFHEILYLMLPMILLPDILNISTKELKLYAKEVFYLAVVSVLISIALAVVITPYFLSEYRFTLGMLLALFTMLMATDAITVGSIMSQFRLPQRLKIYAESESLFNDVTALILFYFVALPLMKGVELDILAINITILKVIFLSTLIGVASAYLGFLFIKILHNPFDQFIIIYLTVMLSFLFAEYFHIAGILSIVASVIMLKVLIQKETETTTHTPNHLHGQRGIYKKIFELLKNVPALSKHEFREYKKEAMYVGVFANSVVFVIIAYMVNIEVLLLYTYEIAVVFVITTLIRFGGIASLIIAMKLPFYWAS